MPKDTFLAADTGLPEERTPTPEPFVFKVSQVLAAEMELPSCISDLAALYDDFRAAQESFFAVREQPRGRNLDLLAWLNDIMSQQARRVIEQLQAMSPEDEQAKYQQAEVLIVDDFRCGGSLDEILARLAVLNAVRVPQTSEDEARA